MKYGRYVQQKTKNLKEIGCEIDVLIVEDDEVLVSQLQTMLMKFFRRVDVALNGLDALNRFSERNYDLVVTDLTMPLIDGFKLIESLKQDKPEQMILVLSAHSESQKLLSLIDMGIDGFILKPVNMEKFIEKLYKACEVIYNRKELARYMQMLEQSNAELLQRDKELKYAIDEVSKLKTEIDEQNLSLPTAMSALEFSELYADRIEHANKEFEALEDIFHTLMIRSEKTFDREGVEMIIELVKKYRDLFDCFSEFYHISNVLKNVEEEFDVFHIHMNIDLWTPILVLLFDLLEQVRKGVFTTQGFNDIHKLDRAFDRVLKQMKQNKKETIDLLEGLLA